MSIKHLLHLIYSLGAEQAQATCLYLCINIFYVIHTIYSICIIIYLHEDARNEIDLLGSNIITNSSESFISFNSRPNVVY